MSYQLLSGIIIDLDNLLLYYFDHRTLGVLQYVDKYNNSLVTNYQLWLPIFGKLQKDFLLPELSSVTKYIKLYEVLLTKSDIKLLEYAEKCESIEILHWLILNDKSIFSSGANILAKHGRLDLLQQLKYTYPDSKGLTMALKNKHYNVLDWVIAKIKIFPDPESVIGDNNFTRMIPFLEKYNNRDGIMKYCQAAIKYNRLDILDWCAEKKVLPTVTMLNDAAERGKIEIIKWGAQHNIFPDGDGSEKALTSNNIAIVLWLNKKGIKPNNLGIYDVIEKELVLDFKMLLSKNIGPSDNDFQVAIEHDKQDLVKLFLQFNYKPSYKALDIAIERQRYDILNLFESYDINIYQENIEQLVRMSNTTMAKYFFEKDFLPVVKDANMLCGNRLVSLENKLEMLKLLSTYHILPDSKGANFILINPTEFSILVCLSKQEILPNQDGIFRLLQHAAIININHFYVRMALKFCICRKVYPAQIDVNNTIFYQEPIILKFLLENNLFPDPYFVRKSLDKIRYVKNK